MRELQQTPNHPGIIDPSPETENESRESDAQRGPQPKAGLIAGAALVVFALAVAVAIVLFTLASPSADVSDFSDVSGQGGEGPLLATRAASLTRSEDGFAVDMNIPTPEAGTYQYPDADMVRPEGASHPEVVPGNSDEAEVFTVWAIVFNAPEFCTDLACDADDIGDTPAQGGVFQIDGHIAAGATSQMAGTVRLGQQAVNGSPLSNPTSAEIHLAIAPHGKAHSGEDLWSQLNSPIGNPTLWWSATFIPG
jgi:hypothetical protein